MNKITLLHQVGIPHYLIGFSFDILVHKPIYPVCTSVVSALCTCLMSLGYYVTLPKQLPRKPSSK